MVALCRHQLVHLNAAGWAAVQQRPWDGEDRACLAHWAATRLPLVVTRQRDGLRAALADRDVTDRRAEEGAARGGRRAAADVIRRVLEA